MKIVAFDLGGVVVDVDKSHLRGLGAADVVDAAFFVGAAGDRHDALSTGALAADAYCAAVANDLGVDVDTVRDAWRRVVRWSQGGRELVREVAAVTTTLFWSNTDPIHWRELGLPDDRCTSFRLGFMKPDPRYFAGALVVAGVDAADVVYVDDLAENVAAAREFGVDAVVVSGVDEARAAIFARLF